ncbi:MAG TPA: hypothetical protein ENJ45_06440 [Phaeodactylibacter sp.]|nr:hypothetical protein [Phaeodactylibacter sp.]
MKVFSFISILFFISTISVDQNLRPYVIAERWSSSFEEAKSAVSTALVNNGFTIAGDYSPDHCSDCHVFAITCSELQSAVRAKGGRTAYAAALRVAVTMEGNEAIVTYTNPAYWGNAYFRKSFPQVKSHYDNIQRKLSSAFSGNVTFGSKKGHSIKKLRGYNYMFGMPAFDDDIQVGSFTSYENAKTSVLKNLRQSSELTKVYEVNFDDMELTLIGVGLGGSEGEKNFMPTIDISKPKHTPFLPYELLIKGNKAYMLHGRFRIALSFPDLSMGTFMKIVSTPGNIEEAMESLCK